MDKAKTQGRNAIGKASALVIVCLRMCRHAGGFGPGADAWKVCFPDGKITVDIQQQADKSLTYGVRLDDRPVVEDSPLGLFIQFVTNSGARLWINNASGDFSKGLTFVKEDERTINETYRLPSGKKSATSTAATSWR